MEQSYSPRAMVTPTSKRKLQSLPMPHLFRPGSISKLFTWTAVMQLVEQGKLELDRDVNEYLDFKIPAKFGKPITLRDLMTHTPGFEEQIKDLITRKKPLHRHIDAASGPAHSGTHLSARHHSRIFQLRSITGRLHRGARLRAKSSMITSSENIFSRWAWPTPHFASRCLPN